MLFWNLFPLMGFASFIKPGTPMTPGQVYTPGNPISGGEFIIPGVVYDPGQAVVTGEFGSSGQVILPSFPTVMGTFIIPNAPPAIPSVLFAELNLQTGNPIETGNAVQAGDAVNGGEGPSGGQAVNGGEGPSGGQAINGGNGPSGGQAVNGGEGPSGGQAVNGGEGPSGGQAVNGGEGPNGGQAVNGGDGPSGGQAVDGGDGPNGGQAVNGGEGPSGGQTVDGGDGPNGGQAVNGGEGPSGGQTVDGGNGPNGGQAVNGGDGPNGGDSLSGGQGSSGQELNGGTPTKGTAETILGFFKDAKKYGVTYPSRLGQILDGALSIAAGFRITDLKTASGNKNLFQIMGSKQVTTATNPFTLWLNQRYQGYLEGFKENKLILRGKQVTHSVYDAAGNITKQNSVFKELRTGTQVKQKRIASFLNENFGGKTVLGAVGKTFNENWNFTNKTFWKPSNIAKGNGIANVVLATGERVISYFKDDSKSFRSTDFAAGITTDVMAGLATTAISAGAGWLATAGTAAAIGSVVPGVGTIVGAVVGLGLGAFLGSPTGKKVTGAVEKGIKTIYDGAMSGLRSARKKFTGLFGSS